VLTSILLIIHLMIASALVGVVLLQRSEGGALGIGGGGGGGFLTGRGTANLLTRTTAILAAAFFATSILLSLSAQRASAPASVFGRDTPLPSATSKEPPPIDKNDPGTQKPSAPGAGGLTDKLPPIPQSK
jgi:preprotein translocase subunit SecG